MALGKAPKMAAKAPAMALGTKIGPPGGIPAPTTPMQRKSGPSTPPGFKAPQSPAFPKLGAPPQRPASAAATRAAAVAPARFKVHRTRPPRRGGMA